jgi:hypothetical protein
MFSELLDDNLLGAQDAGLLPEVGSYASQI